MILIAPHPKLLSLDYSSPLPLADFLSAPSPPTPSAGRPADPPPTHLLQLVDHFTPLGTLGHGNMGTVFLVLSKYSGSPFALKVSRSLSSKKQRSHVEKDILSSLHHPFLQTLHAHFEFGNHSLFLLDFCSGGDLNVLRQRQPERRFSETAARFYAAEVLVALEHMHKLGIVYRDLKPENILLQGNGHIKLTDFDLSLRLDSPSKARNYGRQIPGAMAPSARWTASTLQQHITAEADSEKVKKSLLLHDGIACSRERASKETDPKSLKEDLDRAAWYKFIYSIGKVRTWNLSRLQRLGSNGKKWFSRTKESGAKEGCLSRGTRSLEQKQLSKGSTLNRVGNPRPHSAKCFPHLQSTKDRKDAEHKCVSVVGTDEYVAPEVLRGEEHGFSMDWWSFGVFLYEMIYGHTPFKGRNSEFTLCNILEKEPELPGTKTPAKHLIAQLLVKDPAARLGTAGGASDIKQHPFFHGVKWESLPYICRPPFIPRPLCLAELEERYSAKGWARRSGSAPNHEDELKHTSITCKSWLDDVVESIQAAEHMNEHASSTQYSRSSSSVGFLSSSADGADRELRRDDDVDAIFSSAEWSSELEAGKQTPLM